jgi:nucleoside-diphosphate-sugar epimerase
VQNRKRILVTGRAGFLGSHLGERLLNQAARVICLDNYFTGSRDNILQPMANPQPGDYRGHVNPIGRRSCYDQGKRCAEPLFFDYRHKHKLRIEVARIFNFHYRTRASSGLTGSRNQ